MCLINDHCVGLQCSQLKFFIELIYIVTQIYLFFCQFPALRIDAKACSVKEKLDEKQEELTPSSGDHDNTFDNGSTTSKVVMNLIYI